MPPNLPSTQSLGDQNTDSLNNTHLRTESKIIKRRPIMTNLLLAYFPFVSCDSGLFCSHEHRTCPRVATFHRQNPLRIFILISSLPKGIKCSSEDSIPQTHNHHLDTRAPNTGRRHLTCPSERERARVLDCCGSTDCRRLESLRSRSPPIQATEVTCKRPAKDSLTSYE